ncbi:MAG: DUF1599 domain-containing protein [Prevotellaceae bacterium]|nr:DUF1599 domain-containing protein [Prevotellaceae bacterium]
MTTEEQFRELLKECRSLFVKKLHDYDAAWRVERPSTITDQLYINANRIRTIEMKGKALVDDSIRSEFVGIVNYAIIGLIQLEMGPGESPDDLPAEKAVEAYDRHAEASLSLMLRKNHDYGEAWRNMLISSYTDLILQKVFRTKKIQALDGQTWASEGIDANYMDMLNYAMFALIRLTYADDAQS